MKSKETASEFMDRHCLEYSDAGQFSVQRIRERSNSVSIPHNRRDFYKISLLVKGEGIFTYADKAIHIKDNTISFTNPMNPYSWEPISEKHEGYFCLFTDDFINNHLKADSLSGSPLFKVNGNHVLMPDETAMKLLVDIFERMLTEIQSSYKNKYDLLRSYVQIIIHEALKIQPPDNVYKAGTSSARISELFLELLERQFPIASPQQVIGLKNANEFAGQLSIHTNHLNRALKEALDKTTTELIAERVTKEAKALLLHSNWDIAEIGYCLGFEHPSNFNIFFKKQTGQTPNHFRRELVAIS